MGRVYGSQYVAHSMCITVWENKNAYRVLVGKPEGKKPLGRTGCKRKDNITKELKEIRNCSHWVHMA